MLVRRYEPSDFAQISQWALEGYQTDYTESQFPKTGFIVDGVAAYFMYSTDSSVCFLENMIANKSADPKLKDQAIEAIIQEILKEAASKGFEIAYATTNVPAVVYRAMRHGARAQAKQTLLTKKLIDPSYDGQE